MTGYKIRNNIFTGNHTGMYLRDGLFDVIISDNLFVNNGLSGGEALGPPSTRTTPPTTSRSPATSSAGTRCRLSVVPGPENGGSDVTYIDNVSIDDAHG